MLMMLSNCSNSPSVSTLPPIKPEDANAFCDGEFPNSIEKLGRSIVKNARTNPETVPLWRGTIISGTQVVQGHKAGCKGETNEPDDE